MSQATNKHARKRKSKAAPACTPPVVLSAVDEPPAAWKEAKVLNPGMLVLWRQGDAYAIYGEDRDVALPLIAWPKVKACRGDVLLVPMKQLEVTVGVLLKAGHRIAVCEHMDRGEHTAPPQPRPNGEPAPPWLKLPTGVNVMAPFAEWDAEGRIPEGCTLCELRNGGWLECRAGASLEGTDIDRDWRIVSEIRTAPDEPGGGRSRHWPRRRALGARPRCRGSRRYSPALGGSLSPLPVGPGELMAVRCSHHLTVRAPLPAPGLFLSITTETPP